MSQVSSPGTNIINFLKTTPINSLSYEQRCELKSKRPKPNLSIKEVGKNRTRSFQSSWYDRFSWLTGCVEKNKMFCYVCLMFGEKDSEWCTEGISDLSNVIKKAVKHQSAKHHLLHSEAFHLLGKVRIEHALSEAARLQAIKHNDIVSSNRQYLRRLIQSVVFLSTQELAFRGHREDENSVNKGNYLQLLNLLAQNESIVRDHLQSSSLLKGTSPDIQNDLIEVTTIALNEKIKSELNEAPFVSIQADETLDVSCKSQMSIIFRYCVNDKIEERFVGFYDVSKDKTAVGLSEVIHRVLLDWEVNGQKVVSQTYDGAAVMAGRQGGVQKLVKQFCPHALFVHCYAHQLNLVLLYGSKTIKQVRLFVCALTAFHSFFSKSSKRTVLLTERGFKLPQASSTRWNFHSRAVFTIIKHFKELYSIFNEIIDEESSEWDDETVNCAIGLKRHMDDPTFVYLLCVFEACFIYIDHLFKLLQLSTVSIVTCHKEIEAVIRNMENLRNDTFTDRCIQNSMQLNENVTYDQKKDTLRVLTFEIIDLQTAQMKSRFEDLTHLSFIELVQENKFKDYNKTFPHSKLASLAKQYPFFNTNQLLNELQIVYADQTKQLAPKDLLKYFVMNGLDSIYEEVTKLLRLVLTIPTTTASSERSMSTLKRIKTYLRNSMNNSRLSCLNSLAIEKQLLGELTSEPAFIEHIIDIFAEKKKRRLELMYKTV